ncbi:MAG TPA: DUF4398 domain-containing protein [Rhodanobacteraceae bacterium]
MTRAQQQLAAAQAAQANDYDPVDFGFAQQRLQSAKAAMAAQKYDLASDMANESMADSRLAQTRAELAALRKQIRSARAENARLRSQLLSPPAPATPGQGHGGSNGGLPTQIILQQPATPASSSAPASASSSATHAAEGK